ncbi:DUF1456 family protein [Shewanella gelidii]|uniref:DUF1456 domain-containing protein n=1 Tax=Shewanella gelidii TaxID=1642821 RepID=A0A917JLQ1_9GAMM|nr:DUF1456 family protein [Shewanella gelidii]MCL1096777.1 DUF1456 family protein [Shewanella gelidii]GGI70089.1 DUF1456 domain-containing protein [Shewanella gelidii]
MTNNDILRRLRFVFDFNNAKMIRMFAKVKHEMPQEVLIDLLKKDDEEGFVECDDKTLCMFLDGLIISKRGLKPGAEIPEPATRINNNMIFKKLRVALELKEGDILALLDSVDMAMSKSELSALFRNPQHKNFKICGDQVLRYFIKALSLQHRGK